MKKGALLAALYLLPHFLLAQVKEDVDLLVFGGTIYTLDSAFSTVEAMAVKDGKVYATGTSAELRNQVLPIKELNLQGQFVYPGFNDAHCHFFPYAISLNQLNVIGTSSWQQVLEQLLTFASKQPNDNSWLLGRGWDQNDWETKEYPTNDSLNKYFPTRPVLLKRVDGHAAIANDAALKLAGITKRTKISGGEILRTGKKKPTGLLIDNAVDLVEKKIPPYPDSLVQKNLNQLETMCFAAGLTSVTDCGLDYPQVLQLKKAYDEGSLSIRCNVMLSDKPANYNWLKEQGTINTSQLRVASIKVYADGALGSRGACLLVPYADRQDWRGFLLSSYGHLDSMAKMIAENNWQMCTHAIGDSSVRTMLNIYKKHVAPQQDKRWRIEHAQVVDIADFATFKELQIIPSVQPTHATSDMYWAIERLGNERVGQAYAFKRLLQQNGWLPLGTDFPVEGIDPLRTFYAAVFRKDAKDFPAEGYQMQDALTREEALRGITIWPARASFEDGIKGSLEKGKLADFVVLDKDLMTTPEAEILAIQVLKTYVNGIRRTERIITRP